MHPRVHMRRRCRTAWNCSRTTSAIPGSCGQPIRPEQEAGDTTRVRREPRDTSNLPSSLRPWGSPVNRLEIDTPSASRPCPVLARASMIDASGTRRAPGRAPVVPPKGRHTVGAAHQDRPLGGRWQGAARSIVQTLTASPSSGAGSAWSQTVAHCMTGYDTPSNGRIRRCPPRDRRSPQQGGAATWLRTTRPCQR